ncbi:MAG: MarR family winged helix-turn-helix transcriptional regulator [Vicinamibacterales bacterium]
MLILRAAQGVRGHLNTRLGAFGLNDVRFAVLRRVATAAPDECSQVELAGELQQSESSVSTLVDRMRADGLLYRVRSRSDRRKWVLMLTDLGRERLAQGQHCLTTRGPEILEPLTREQIAHVSALLISLSGAGADDDPRGHVCPLPTVMAPQRLPAAA